MAAAGGPGPRRPEAQDLTPLLLSLGLLLGPARAELPPPDYRSALLATAERQADALIAEGRLDEALALVIDFRQRVADDARLVYEEGLIHRYRGENDQALVRFEEAVTRDPSLGFAWYDLGEVRLLLGHRPGAREALRQASVRTVDHDKGWVPPLKLAEMAAQDGDPDGWDRWLREALRRGFRLQLVVDNPEWAAQWRGWLAEPALGDVLRRLATVYGEETALESLRAP